MQDASLIGKMNYQAYQSIGSKLYITTESPDFSVPVMDKITDQEIRKLIGHEALVTAGKVSSDDTLVLSGTENGEVKLWDVQTGRCLKTVTITGPAQPIIYLDF